MVIVLITFFVLVFFVFRHEMLRWAEIEAERQEEREGERPADGKEDGHAIRKDRKKRTFKGFRDGMKGEVIARHLWRIARRWKWSITAILVALSMTYVLLWFNNPLMEMFLPVDRVMSSYLILGAIIYLIIFQILHELELQYRTYYICQSCNQNFVLDGLQDPDARCPFCSSKKLHVVMSAEKREYKTVPKSPKEIDRASYVVGVLNELCRHLQQIGIGLTIVWDDPSPQAIHYQKMPGTFGGVESPLGCIKVEGKCIDTVRICIESELPYGYGKLDHWFS